MRPPYSQNWNLHRTDAGPRLSAGRSLRRQQRHPSVALHRSQPEYLRTGRQRRQQQSGPRVHHLPRGRPCDYGSVGWLADKASSTYHALEVAFSRQYAHGLSFLASYWYSKSLDYISALNVAGSAPTLVAGENDLAQNPFNLRAEHGPSLFDAAHRFVLSGTWALPARRGASRAMALLINGWQFNAIAALSTGTPYRLRQRQCGAPG